MSNSVVLRLKPRHRSLLAAAIFTGIGTVAAALPSFVQAASADAAQSYLIQGKQSKDVAALVRSLGAEVTHELAIINAVGARLTPAQYEQLTRNTALRIQSDGGLHVNGTSGSEVLIQDKKLYWTLTNNST